MKKIAFVSGALAQLVALALSASAADGLATLKSQGFTVYASPKAAPDFTVKRLDGTEVSLASLKGKVVMVNFWATWCPPCRGEMPDIEKLYAKTKGLPFEILAISSQESSGTVSGFLKSNKYTFPIYLDSSGSVSRKYGISAIPTTYIIDAEGKMVARMVGAYDYDSAAFESAIKALIGK
jgi:peroxiredoxin